MVFFACNHLLDSFANSDRTQLGVCIFLQPVNGTGLTWFARLGETRNKKGNVASLPGLALSAS